MSEAVLLVPSIVFAPDVVVHRCVFGLHEKDVVYSPLGFSALLQSYSY